MENVRRLPPEHIPPRSGIPLSAVVRWSGPIAGRGRARLTDGREVSASQMDNGLHWTQDTKGPHWRGVRRREEDGTPRRCLDPQAVELIMFLETSLIDHEGLPSYPGARLPPPEPPLTPFEGLTD